MILNHDVLIDYSSWGQEFLNLRNRYYLHYPKSARLHSSIFWVTPSTKRVSLKKLLSHLAVIGVNSVFVEPGPTLYKSFKREGLIDELIVYKSKKKLGNGLRIEL